MANGQIPKQEIIAKFRQHGVDTGSAEVQIALLSARIDHLTDHVQRHKKDHHTRLGLLKLVGKRRRLLDYLKARDHQQYQKIIEALNLRR